MQLLAVISPLITQSVIDKVLVHRSMSTLDVLAVGLIIITVFETVLSLSRNYVFAHTTSRIDVILSCKVFRHLFHLPLRYFESHRVGDTIARVKELETIRRFLTGLPMSTLLDAVFIVVYLVFMFFYSTKLTLLTIASLPVLALISILATPVLKGHIDEKFRCGARVAVLSGRGGKWRPDDKILCGGTDRRKEMGGAFGKLYESEFQDDDGGKYGGFYRANGSETV